MQVTLKNIVPIMNDIIVTANKKTVTPSGVILPDDNSAIEPIQKVLSIGPHVIDIEVGDMVEIDPESFPKELIEKAKNDVGSDRYGPKIPLYSDDEKTHFMKIKTSNILWKVKE